MDWNEEELLNDGLTDEQRRVKLHACDDFRQNQLLFSLALAYVWNFPNVSGIDWVRNNEQLLLSQGFRKEVIDKFCEPNEPFDYMKWFKEPRHNKDYSLDHILSKPEFQCKVKFPVHPVCQSKLTDEEKADWEYFNLQMLMVYMSEKELKEFQEGASKGTKTALDWDGLKERLKDHHIPSKPILTYRRPDGGYDSVSQDTNCQLPTPRPCLMGGWSNGIYPVRNTDIGKK